MSIVAVHGPSMITGSGSTGGAVTETAQVRAVADMTNGWKFTFSAIDQSRNALDYDWATPGGTPALLNDAKSVTVTYASAGAKTATLTIAAGAGPPAGGTYPITVTATGATAGVPRALVGGGEEESEVEEEEGFNPADYTIDEIEDFIRDNPEEAESTLAKEQEGKNRKGLVTFLEGVIEAE